MDYLTTNICEFSSARSGDAQSTWLYFVFEAILPS